MTIKEYRNLSGGERRKVHKDWLVTIGLSVMCSVIFAALALMTQCRMG